MSSNPSIEPESTTETFVVRLESILDRINLEALFSNSQARLKTGEAADGGCIVLDQPQSATTVGVVEGSLRSGFAHCCGSQNRAPSEYAPAFNHASNSHPLEVELGSGDGSFLVNYARTKPGTNFLGVERLLGRLRKIDRKSKRLGLTNVRLLRIEASYLLEFLLPKKSVQALHIYFPDPWPKRKHRKNRLINEQFTCLAESVLKPSGLVYLRTDDQDYFTQMTQVFGSSPVFEPAETPDGLQMSVTDFERNFNARNVPTLRASYRLKL